MILKLHKVYGKRTCRRCHGICGVDSVRKNYGQRRGCWCSWHCVEMDLEDRLIKAWRKEGLMIKNFVELNEHQKQLISEYIEDSKKYYERVYVVPPKGL